jgi:hypothetical protein
MKNPVFLLLALLLGCAEGPSAHDRQAVQKVYSEMLQCFQNLPAIQGEDQGGQIDRNEKQLLTRLGTIQISDCPGDFRVAFAGFTGTIRWLLLEKRRNPKAAKNLGALFAAPIGDFSALIQQADASDPPKLAKAKSDLNAGAARFVTTVQKYLGPQAAKKS